MLQMETGWTTAHGLTTPLLYDPPIASRGFTPENRNLCSRQSLYMNVDCNFFFKKA